MARFYFEIDGGRGPVHRLGHPSSGGHAIARGWDVGVEVHARVVEGRDTFCVFVNRGSNGGTMGERLLVGTGYLAGDGRLLFSPGVEPWALELGEPIASRKAPEVEEDDQTYEVVRFFRDEGRQSEVILDGLSLEEAKEHCNRDDTRGDGWFDGYRAE